MLSDIAVDAFRHGIVGFFRNGREAPKGEGHRDGASGLQEQIRLWTR
jgi:hypothetical protein